MRLCDFSILSGLAGFPGTFPGSESLFGGAGPGGTVLPPLGGGFGDGGNALGNFNQPDLDNMPDFMSQGMYFGSSRQPG